MPLCHTFHSTSVSVDQTPQWFLLHCSIGVFKPASGFHITSGATDGHTLKMVGSYPIIALALCSKQTLHRQIEEEMTDGHHSYNYSQVRKDVASIRANTVHKTKST